MKLLWTFYPKSELVLLVMWLFLGLSSLFAGAYQYAGFVLVILVQQHLSLVRRETVEILADVCKKQQLQLEEWKANSEKQLLYIDVLESAAKRVVDAFKVEKSL